MKKFLSLILALTLVASLFTVNVMAASAHTVTIAAEPAKDLKAGDTVTVELSLDDTEGLLSFEYVLSYDTTAFTADTTKVSRLESCIDKTWLDGMKDTDGDWGYYLGNPTYKVDTAAGTFAFAWAGSEGVEAEYAVKNRVVGKFIFTVADGAVDGDYEFSLTGKTKYSGDSLPTEVTCAPITVKVGADGPAVVTPDVAAGDAVDTPYTNAFAVKTVITPGSATEIGVLFAPDKWLGDKTLDLSLVGAAKASMAATGAGTVTLKAAIRDIPRDVEGKAFKMVTRAYATNGADVTEYADVVETDYTAFAE